MAEEPGPDRNLAFAALLLLLTAFWLPFWVVRLEDAGGVTTTAVRVFQTLLPVTTGWAPHITGALLGLVALALLVRLAARSWFHEPAVWRRTLAASALALLAANLLLVAWPQSIPTAWGQRSLRDDAGDVVATETAMPGLAWYLTLGAAVLLGVAWYLVRNGVGESELDTSDK